MTDLVKRLRVEGYGKDVHLDRNDYRLMHEAADRIEELEAGLDSVTTNIIKLYGPECEKHTGENTVPFDEWQEKYATRCAVCDAHRIAELEAELKVTHQDAAFYLCCARLGEVPEPGSEPSAGEE